MLRAQGLEIKVLGPGAKLISSLKSAVFVSNHQSAIDILAHIMILPSNAHFVAKKSCFGFLCLVGEREWWVPFLLIEKKGREKVRFKGCLIN